MLTAGGKKQLEFKSGDRGSGNWGFWGLKVQEFEAGDWVLE